MRRIALLLGTLAVLISVPAAAKPPAPTRKPSGPKLTLSTPRLYRVGGGPVALAGQTWRVVATTSQFAAGQSITFTFTRNGHLLRRTTVAIRPGSHGVGLAATAFRLSSPGRVRVTAAHAATLAQAAMTVRGRVDAIQPYSGFGSGGLRVRYLQSRLRGTGYAVHLTGRFDDQTARAVIAFRKVNRMVRGGPAIGRIYHQLARGRGAFHARYPGQGRHLEADLSRQVLALLNGGRSYRVYHISSGKPSTPTVLGSYYVYLKTPGYNSLGMLDSNYFIDGYAVHGYHEVPLYAASHGCIRAPIPDAGALYGWIHIGTRIDVYH